MQLLNKKFIYFLLPIFIIFGWLMLSSMNKKETAAPKKNISQMEYLVKYTNIADLKPIAAEVSSIKTCYARSLISGIVNKLLVTEGEYVNQDQLVAEVTDSKIDSKINSIEERIRAVITQKQNAKVDYERYLALKKSGTVSKSDSEKYETTFKVLEANLKSLEFDKETLMNQKREGIITSPQSGKILNLLVTNGSVVMPGDNLIEIACNGFILRLNLPEGDSDYIKLNDKIRLNNFSEYAIISKIYPKINNGNIIIEATLNNIESSYIGKLVGAYVKTGEHKGFLIPNEYFISKNGLDFLKLKDVGEIIIQTGRKDNGLVEVISGLKENDILVSP